MSSVGGGQGFCEAVGEEERRVRAKGGCKRESKLRARTGHEREQVHVVSGVILSLVLWLKNCLLGLWYEAVGVTSIATIIIGCELCSGTGCCRSIELHIIQLVKACQLALVRSSTRNSRHARWHSERDDGFNELHRSTAIHAIGAKRPVSRYPSFRFASLTELDRHASPLVHLFAHPTCSNHRCSSSRSTETRSTHTAPARTPDLAHPPPTHPSRYKTRSHTHLAPRPYPRRYRLVHYPQFSRLALSPPPTTHRTCPRCQIQHTIPSTYKSHLTRETHHRNKNPRSRGTLHRPHVGRSRLARGGRIGASKLLGTMNPTSCTRKHAHVDQIHGLSKLQFILYWSLIVFRCSLFVASYLVSCHRLLSNAVSCHRSDHASDPYVMLSAFVPMRSTWAWAALVRDTNF